MRLHNQRRKYRPSLKELRAIDLSTYCHDNKKMDKFDFEKIFKCSQGENKMNKSSLAYILDKMISSICNRHRNSIFIAHKKIV